MAARILWAAAGAVVLIGLGGAWALTAPRPLPEDAVDGWSPDAASIARGERLFHLGGCANCHADPSAEGAARLVLSGGLRLKSEFGTFVAPNISPHPEAGIGEWTPVDFASALLRGVSPGGAHYYPAFPYPSYARMEVSEALDLFAYLQTLPGDPTASAPHELRFPFNIRPGVGAWKLLNLHPEPVVTGDLSDQALRGRALAEGPGHCGECHTPRDALGGPSYDRWLAGGPNPDGDGRIPNITPSAQGLGGWSETDIAYYLETGFTPDYDSAGGAMAAVISELSKLPPEDREAIAAYLKAVPPVE